MCFDSTTSAITFSITTLSAIYLYNRGYKTNNKNDKFFSLLVLLIGFMQLIEYFIWKNQNCNSKNHFFSILIIVLLTIQPILCYNWYYYLHKNITGLSYNLVLLYSIVFFCYNAYLINWLNQSSLCSKPTKRSCRLNWDPFTKLTNIEPYFYLWGILYFIPWFSMFFDIYNFNNKAFKKYPLRHIFIPITFFFSVLYILKQNNDIMKFIKNPLIFTKHIDIWGSLWCFSAIFLGIVGILEI